MPWVEQEAKIKVDVKGKVIVLSVSVNGRVTDTLEGTPETMLVICEKILDAVDAANRRQEVELFVSENA